MLGGKEAPLMKGVATRKQVTNAKQRMVGERRGTLGIEDGSIERVVLRGGLSYDHVAAVYSTHIM
jgi:hypothetical protein